MIPKERIFLKGDVMTNYQKILLIRSEVKKTLKKHKKGKTVESNLGESKNLPSYITNNPFYP